MINADEQAISDQLVAQQQQLRSSLQHAPSSVLQQLNAFVLLLQEYYKALAVSRASEVDVRRAQGGYSAATSILDALQVERPASGRQSPGPRKRVPSPYNGIPQ